MASSRLSRGVLHTIRHRGLLGDADRVAVAVSGGPDSVALAWVLRELEARAAWRLVGLIHVHHGLRGAEADADAAFCRELAARMDLPIEVASADVRRLARERRLSIEAAGRHARYQAFDAARQTLDATRVATGHTRDDQAETVLLRLLRGASTRGVSGIRASLDRVVRPLIDVRRAAVVEYLDDRGLRFREDSTNRDLSIPRNRVRAVLVPVIETHWPGAVTALARFAELAADDEAWLTEQAAASRACLEGASDGVNVNLSLLDTLPRAVARRVARGAIEAAGGKPTFRDVEAICRLGRADKRIVGLDLAGLTAHRAGGGVRLGPGGARRRTDALPEGEARRLAVPGEVQLAETGDTIRASLVERASIAALPSLNGPMAVVQAHALSGPLIVRYRRPGDRLRPLGAPGTRKLQDVFVDRKVPRPRRDRVPIVVDSRDRIVWVAGFTIAHEFRVTAPGEGVVVLKLDKGNK